MKDFNEIPKERIIRTIQSYMTDPQDTEYYLETLSKDELRTILIQFVVASDERNK